MLGTFLGQNISTPSVLFYPSFHLSVLLILVDLGESNLVSISLGAISSCSTPSISYKIYSIKADGVVSRLPIIQQVFNARY